MNTDEYIAAIEGSIEHWDTMIKWARAQPPDKPVATVSMENEIGVSWYHRSCPLCYTHDNCMTCPIEIPCSSPVSDWMAVRRSRTWGDWVYQAGKMVRGLESCLIKAHERASVIR